jgi:uncharacterized membrane protein YciS (DUF1049 family)
VWVLRSVIILVGVIAFLWITVNNAGQQVDFVFFTKSYQSLSLNLLMLIVFALGMVFSFFIFVFNEFQLRHRISRQQREVERLERELAALRNLPLEDGDTERVR